MSDKTGGPAFPNSIGTGMTLRDYFAAKAMAAVLAGWPAGVDLPPESFVAQGAYKQAAAMLEAREAP